MNAITQIITTLIILNIIQCNDKGSSPITINFKKKYNLNTSLNKSEIINIIGKNILKTEIGIGTPSTNLVFNIDTSSQFTYILTDNTVYEHIEPKDYIKYNPNNSRTYKIINKTNVMADIFDNAYYIKESLHISDRTLSDFNLLEPLYVYFSEELTEDNCLLGLGLISYNKYSEMPANFIKTLKDKNIINNYYFFFHFINETDGVLVIGTTPNEYDNIIYPNAYNVFSRLPSSDRNVKWGFNIDRIYYNEKEFINLKATSMIKLNYGYIDFGPTLFNELTYLKELIKNTICMREGTYVKTYTCYKNKFDKTKFGSIKLYNSQFNTEFILDLSSLFIDVGDYSYFLVRHISNDYAIILGEPFLRKYTILFDQDSKLLYYFSNSVNKSNTNKAMIAVIIILIVLVIIIVSIIVYIKYKNITFLEFIFNKRRKGIEMSEDLDYQELSNNKI